ncbi:hypothetical protein ACIBEA_06555 [Streptomyces sp. NPDC051555]|uniref:hypothetical protein n=1 Tax=Streptomyces sp. NPDC051555 TaxID=3365657 RepID=UPI00378E02B4
MKSVMFLSPRGAATQLPIQGSALTKPFLLTFALTSPLLFVLGSASAVIGQHRHDHLSVATALCLCVSLAGLIGWELSEVGYRRDPAVFLHIAAYPRVTPEQIARALGIADKVVAASLVRLVEGGALVRVGESTSAEGNYRLASCHRPARSAAPKAMYSR